MTDQDALAAQVIAAYRAAGLTIGTAESCTGGLIAGALTDVSGSSHVLDRGLVTYSNQAKQDLLGVRAETLAAHGAVSAETAGEMAAGVLARSPVDCAVAVTGIAGPGGGTATKPVGLVHFGAARRGGPVALDHRVFPGDRAAVRRATVRHALEMLLALIR